MKTNVYVDGFNLYYRVRNTPYRWLNVLRLCQVILPENQIQRARYFTARVSATPDDPHLPQRQQVYLRALQTIPNLTIHYGQFLRHQTRMPLLNPLPDGRQTVAVWKTEEKGSDVNLASYLLLDAFNQEYEAAIVITNDSDLAEPIRIVRRHFGLKVVVLHPVKPRTQPGKPTVSIELKKAASKSIVMDDWHLENSQFPAVLQDAHGTIRKPSSW